MASGRPVVATRVGGLVDAIEDGVDGVLVSPGDVAALREAVERLLQDPDLRHSLGTAAREHAREKWTVETAAGAARRAYTAAWNGGRR
jgi:glycosyltransferase involved in cell wall biosynthesis